MIVLSQALVLQAAAEPLSLALPILGWRTIVTANNLTTDTAETDNPASNLANPLTHLIWRGVTGSPPADEHLTLATGSADPIDYVAVARHDFGTAGIAVSVEKQEGSPPAWVELVEPFIPADDAPLLMRFDAAPVADIRVRLQPGSAAPEAAVIYIGKLLVLERGVQAQYTPLPYGRVSTVVTGRSESGNYLGRITTGARTESSASIANLTASFYRVQVDPFVAAARELPFFFAWKPLDFPAEVGFAWLGNDPRPSFDLDGFVALGFEMTGIVS